MDIECKIVRFKSKTLMTKEICSCCHLTRTMKRKLFTERRLRPTCTNNNDGDDDNDDTTIKPQTSRKLYDYGIIRDCRRAITARVGDR